MFLQFVTTVSQKYIWLLKDNLCRLFGDVCEGELLMQRKSNLAPGRCAVWCCVCVCVCLNVSETL